MKKLLLLLCAAMLSACCCVLAACGGAASSGSASGSAESSAATATADFVGDWLLAGGESQGVTVTGDFAAMFGVGENMKFTINEDGTGSASYGNDARSFTWEASGDAAIKITMASESGSSASASAASESASAASADSASAASAESAPNEPTEFTLADGVLRAEMTNNGQTVAMLFTKDGKLPNAVEINVADATPITDEATLVGDWKLMGMNLMGMTAYGEPEALAALGSGAETSLSFAEGGKCTMGGQSAEYKVSSDGAAITQSGVQIPVKALGDKILVDMGTASGMGIDMVMVYSK